MMPIGARRCQWDFVPCVTGIPSLSGRLGAAPASWMADIRRNLGRFGANLLAAAKALGT
jgi:hypothetical protein